MIKLKTAHYGTDIVIEYSIATIIDRETALAFAAKVSQTPLFSIEAITAEDFLSFHDGTETKRIAKPSSIDKFISEYINTGYKAINFNITYKRVPFSVGVNLETQKIVIGYQSKFSNYYNEFEQLFSSIK